MDTFKTAVGEVVNPIPIEDRFRKNSYINQTCLFGMNLPQPVLLVVLSDVARKLDKKEVEKSLKKTLSSANNQLTSAEKVSHIFIVQEPWTPENMLLTPTLTLNRNTIHEKYMDAAKLFIKSTTPIIWESSI